MVVKPPDIRSLLRMLNMTQEAFCDAFGFDLKTLRAWEKNKQKPNRAACVLLRIIHHSPETVLKALI
jgi:putative transcriptional regulator